MSIRLATLLALPILATACVTESDPLDDLPAYDSDSGGGKGDDPNCTDVTYREFFKQYRAGTADAEANPCKSGNDASFRIWAYVVGKELAPTFEAYNAIIVKRFNDRNVTNDQINAAATLSDTQRANLATFAKVRPQVSGRVGMGAWVEFVYKPAHDLATRAIGNSTPLPDSINQTSRQITPMEDEWLKIAEDAKPQLTEQNGWAIWYTVTEKQLDEARRMLPFVTNDADRAIEKGWLERLGATAPRATFDADGAAFQVAFTVRVAESSINSPGGAAAWQAAAAMKPPGGGRASYGKWVGPFVKFAETWNARARNDEEKALLEVVLAAKPCAAMTDANESGTVADVVGRVKTGLAQAGNAPNGTSFADLAVPVACPMN